MTSSITPFAFGENMLRVQMDEHGNPWFVAKDVCRVLEISNHNDAVSQLDDDEKGVAFTDPLSQGGQQQVRTISESGLYALVFRSRKPEARAFSKWVRSDVLPALRKSGSYAMPGRAAAEDSLPMSSLPNIPEMAGLRPMLRMRAWESALQAARLDSQGMDFALSCFAQICRMLSINHSPRRMDDDNSQRILQFVDALCRPEPGGRIRANRVYEAFCLWWRRNFVDPEPSMHFFGARLATLFAKRKRGGNTFYYGLRVENS